MATHILCATALQQYLKYIWNVQQILFSQDLCQENCIHTILIAPKSTC